MAFYFELTDASDVFSLLDHNGYQYDYSIISEVVMQEGKTYFGIDLNEEDEVEKLQDVLDEEDIEYLTESDLAGY